MRLRGGHGAPQGWSIAEGVSSLGSKADYSLYADVFFVDGTHEWGVALAFDPAAEGWQQVHGVLHAPRAAILRVELYCMLRWRQGAARFDDIRLTALDDGVCAVERLVGFAV
jgi:hypothetical protein